MKDFCQQFWKHGRLFALFVCSRAGGREHESWNRAEGDGGGRKLGLRLQPGRVRTHRELEKDEIKSRRKGNQGERAKITWCVTGPQVVAPECLLGDPGGVKQAQQGGLGAWFGGLAES